MSVSVPEGVIGDILNRLATLEGQSTPPAAETLTPNYLTVNPDGTTGANFTGLVNALGLMLPAGTNPTPSPTNRIVWERQSDGAIVASEFGYRQGTTSELDLDAHGLLNGDDVIATLRALDQNGTVQSALRADSLAGLTGQSPAGNVDIFDNTGASTFVQGAITGWHIAGGSVTVTWGGASPISSVVSTGGVVPITSAAGIICSNISQSGGIPAGTYHLGTSPASFDISAVDPAAIPVAGTTASIYWLAFGF